MRSATPLPLAAYATFDGRIILADPADTEGAGEETHGHASLFYQVMAEAIGVLFIVIVGVNAVHGAILAQGAAGNFQVGMMFALGIMWGIYTTGSVSSGHINPAITVSQKCILLHSH